MGLVYILQALEDQALFSGRARPAAVQVVDDEAMGMSGARGSVSHHVRVVCVQLWVRMLDGVRIGAGPDVHGSN